MFYKKKLLSFGKAVVPTEVYRTYFLLSFIMRAWWHRLIRNLTKSSCSSGSDETSTTESAASVPAVSGSNSHCAVGDEANALDSIESTEARLKHPTADRARPPARRPPSHIGQLLKYST